MTTEWRSEWEAVVRPRLKEVLAGFELTAELEAALVQLHLLSSADLEKIKGETSEEDRTGVLIDGFLAKKPLEDFCEALATTVPQSPLLKILRREQSQTGVGSGVGEATRVSGTVPGKQAFAAGGFPCINISPPASTARKRPLTGGESLASKSFKNDLEDDLHQSDILIPDALLPYAHKEDEIDFFMPSIGSGAFSSVYRCRVEGRNGDLAVKRLGRINEREFFNEATTLSKVKPHENITMFFGICCTTSYLGLLMEFVPDGTLTELIDSNDNALLSWSNCIRLSRQIADGMAHLHGHKPPIIHRDLKTGNVLIDKSNTMKRITAKVCDFGMAKMQGISELTISHKVVFPGGTPAYIAPERYDGSSAAGDIEVAKKSDVYSFGGILFAIRERHQPYHDEPNASVIRGNVLAGVILSCKRDAPGVYRALQTRCIARAPEDRPSFRETVSELARLEEDVGNVIGESPGTPKEHFSCKYMAQQNEKPIIFISFANEREEEANDRLLRNLDQLYEDLRRFQKYEVKYSPKLQPEIMKLGLRVWEERAIQHSSCILMICTRTYKEKVAPKQFDGDAATSNVADEYRMISASPQSRGKTICVLLPSEKEDASIPPFFYKQAIWKQYSSDDTASKDELFKSIDVIIGSLQDKKSSLPGSVPVDDLQSTPGVEKRSVSRPALLQEDVVMDFLQSSPDGVPDSLEHTSGMSGAQKAHGLWLTQSSAGRDKKIFCELERRLDGVLELDFRKANLANFPVKELLEFKDLVKSVRMTSSSVDRSVPIQISELGYLEEFEARGNVSSGRRFDEIISSFTVFPRRLVFLDRLRKLDLSDNFKLTSVPSDVGSWFHQLYHLCLRGCGFQELPETFWKPNLSAGTSSQCTSDSNIAHLDLASNSFSALPEGIALFTQLKHLDLSYNKIKAVPVGACDRLRNLDSLLLQECGLQELPADFLRASETSPRLTCLNLSNNCLMTIPKEIVNFTSLKNLNIADNRIETISSTCSPALGKLMRLNLTSCGLKELPSNFCASSSALVYLSLSHNKLSTLPKGILNSSSLEHLAISNNALAFPPAAYERLRRIRHLDLSECSLKNDFWRCYLRSNVAVVYLNLCKNDLTYVPSRVFNLPELKTLNISDNEIPSLPDGIFQGGKLERFCVSGCGLTELPVEFLVPRCESSLIHLDLSRNKLTKFPTEIANFKNLKFFDISWNPLKTIPPCVCRQLLMVEHLGLWACELKEFPSEFWEMSAEQPPSITHLDIDDNEFTALPDSIKNFSQLKILSAANNNIKVLPRAVCFTPADVLLFFRNNPLTIPPGSLCAKGGIRGISQYFKDLDKASSERPRRIKIVILGLFQAGKTSLIKTIKEQKTVLTDAADRTICMEIMDMKVGSSESLCFKAFDCGGQKSYLCTNYLPVSNNSIVIVAADAHLYDETEERFMESFGRHINLVFERAERAYVLLVFTKVDRNAFSRAAIEKKRRDAMVRAEKLQQARLSFIRERSNFGGKIKIHDKVILTSSRDMEGIHELSEVLVTAGRKEFFPVEVTLPLAWKHMEEALAVMPDDMTALKAIDREQKPQNSFEEEFRNRLKESGTQNLPLLRLSDVEWLGALFGLEPNSVNLVLNYLHDVGSVFFFSNDPLLREYVFTKPNFLISIIRKVFRHDHSLTTTFTRQFSESQFRKWKEDLLDNATLQLPLLRYLWSDITVNAKHLDVFLHVLLSLGLAYVKKRLIDRKSVSEDAVQTGVHPFVSFRRLQEEKSSLLLPWFFKEEKPDRLNDFWPSLTEEDSRVVLTYSFCYCLPLGLFSSFSARCYSHAAYDCHWETGMALKYGPVFVLFEAKKSVITLSAKAVYSQNNSQRLWHVLWRYVMELEALLSSMSGIGVIRYMTKDGFDDNLDENPNKKEKLTPVAGGPTFYLQNVTDVVGFKLAIQRASQETNRSLQGIFSSSCGRTVEKRELQLIASEFLKLETDPTCLVNRLRIAWEKVRKIPDYCTREIKARHFLELWFEETFKEGSAIVCVLCDALEDAGLKHVAQKHIAEAHPSGNYLWST